MLVSSLSLLVLRSRHYCKAYVDKATVVWHRGVWDSRLPPWLGNTQCASIVRMSTGLTADLRTERPGPVG